MAAAQRPGSRGTAWRCDKPTTRAATCRRDQTLRAARHRKPAIRVGEGKWCEKQRTHGAEERRVRANPDCDRQSGGGGEGRLGAQNTNGVTHIVAKRLHAALCRSGRVPSIAMRKSLTRQENYRATFSAEKRAVAPLGQFVPAAVTGKRHQAQRTRERASYNHVVEKEIRYRPRCLCMVERNGGNDRAGRMAAVPRPVRTRGGRLVLLAGALVTS